MVPSSLTVNTYFLLHQQIQAMSGSKEVSKGGLIYLLGGSGDKVGMEAE